MPYNRGSNRGAPQQYDNNMRGAVFENDRQEKDGDPHMKGQCEVDGVEYWVAGWWKTPKNKGPDFLSLAFTRKDERRSQANDKQPQRQPYGQGNRAPQGRNERNNPGRRGPNSDQHDDMDEDIPF